LCSGIMEEESDQGLQHQYFSPYTPQQNGVIEPKNRTLVEMARTMLDEATTRAVDPAVSATSSDDDDGPDPTTSTSRGPIEQVT